MSDDVLRINVPDDPDIQSLSYEAKLILLIFARNGGSMTKADAEAELFRIMMMNSDDRKVWIAETKELIRQEFERRVQ